MSEPRLPAARRRLNPAAVAVAVLTSSALGWMPLPAHAAAAVSATFSGGAGTVTTGDMLYARQGAALTLTVATSPDTRCVDVADALTGHQHSTIPRSSWTFTFAAGSGNGDQAITVAASPNVNPQGRCTGSSATTQASYRLDNAGPVLAAAVQPAANAAGWNNANVGLSWSATDAGAGVGSGPSPATDGVTSDTTGSVRTATAVDRLGNTGTGTVSIKLDKAAPAIGAARTPAANAFGWNNTDVTVALTCADTLSGVKSCTGGGSVVVTTEGANQSVTGSAVDNADNTATATVTAVNIDKSAPTLRGTPTSAENAAGWYRDDVGIRWTATDSLSGLAGSGPANTSISGEGRGLTSTASVSNKAGNVTTADSLPVDIDRTPPVTGISGRSNDWTNDDVTISLSPSDNLAGIATTAYRVDDGAVRTGTSLTLTGEGNHTVSFFSTDKAGNAEPARTAHVRIDRTAPTIAHSFTPTSYADGAWTNQTVTVTFECADTGSGVATCSGPVTKSAEGAAQQVVGTATDTAGNSATDTAVVNLDKTEPEITAAPDRAPNQAGWYQDDVTVTFAASDALSGVAELSGPKVVGEGTGQTAAGTATDSAGNSARAEVAGIDVDKTPPRLAAEFSPGWHTGDVAVAWSCADTRSGVAAAPVDDTVTGEGADLASAATCTDKAGNTAASAVAGIKIDRGTPSTTVGVAAPQPSGWYADAVRVNLTGHDPLSGVGATYYRVDAGPAQPYTEPFSFATKGVHTISYWSVDVAGNVEDAAGNSLTLKIDGNPPTTTVLNPISPASGWFVSTGIPVAFDVADAESGIAATYYQIDGATTHTYGIPVTVDLSTGSHTISYWSVDLAGNVEAKQTTVVRVDTVAPAITATRVPGPNAHGWNRTDVDVKFTCTDQDSGLDGVIGCGPDAKVASEGSGQRVVGNAQDIAGNKSSTAVDPINIDKTPPSLSGAATTDANGAGWYRNDVRIAWAGDDGLSGIDTATQPADSVITGEGSNLGASASIADQAGNTRSASVTGIKVDRTAPVVSGAATTSPNTHGWYRDQVTIDYTCSDQLSGVAHCATSTLIAGNGANQSVTSEPATDQAGNTSAGRTVGGINLDGSAPSTTANNQCTKANGWCTGPTANVVLSAADQTGLSGVKEIHYRIDGGSEQVAAGATKTVTVALDGSGAGTVTYWAVDYAGNIEAPSSVALRWDNIAPTVTHTLAPAANANDWNNADTTVTFAAKDDDTGSGVATVTAPVTTTAETPGQAVTGSATDTAGNVGTDSVTVRLDKTAPAISAAIMTGTKGSNGWYTGPVTVGFTCADTLSGIGTCSDDVTLTANGVNTASGTAFDKAGNSATATLPRIFVDDEKPTITNVNLTNGFYTLGAVPAATCAASDSFSGLAGSCTVSVTGGTASGVGTFTYTATATDMAGNKATTTGSYRVVYRFGGFLQPINDTAHQSGASTSVFKAGSTVAVKFQLTRSNGTAVQASTTPVWPTPAKGVSMSLPVDESVYSTAGDSGSTYRHDATAQQYIYNWKTTAASAGYYHRVGATLDDGQSYYVNLGLRN